MQKQLYINNNGASRDKLLLENGEDGTKEVSNYQFNFNILVPMPHINTLCFICPNRGCIGI